MAANKSKTQSKIPANKFAQDDDLELVVDIPVVKVRCPGAFKGAMVLPSLDYTPFGVGMASNGEQAAAIKDWLAELGCDTQLRVIQMIPQNRVELFMKEWGKVSNVDLPKSKG